MSFISFRSISICIIIIRLIYGYYSASYLTNRSETITIQYDMQNSCIAKIKCDTLNFVNIKWQMNWQNYTSFECVRNKKNSTTTTTMTTTKENMVWCRSERLVKCKCHAYIYKWRIERHSARATYECDYANAKKLFLLLLSVFTGAGTFSHTHSLCGLLIRHISCTRASEYGIRPINTYSIQYIVHHMCLLMSNVTRKKNKTKMNAYIYQAIVLALYWRRKNPLFSYSSKFLLFIDCSRLESAA